MVKKIVKFLFKKYAFYLVFLVIVSSLLWSILVSNESKNNTLLVSSHNYKHVQYLKSNFFDEFCKYSKSMLIGKFNLVNNISKEFQNMVFNLSYNQQYEKHVNFEFVKNLRHGGSHQPKLEKEEKCKMKALALIIPYKNRLNNLYTFLYNMHPYLQRQQLRYTIFLVEQINVGLFNKGIINNAAFNEIILKKNSFFKSDSNFFDEYDCVMYHDVDLLPTDDLNLYSCPDEKPVHYSIFVDNTDYTKVWPILIGGVIIFDKEHYIKANGYSNRFWGWGGEDDDMYLRLTHSKINFTRPVKSTLYTMLHHQAGQKNINRFKLLNESIDAYRNEGLNNVKYNLINIIKYPLFTHLLVDIGQEVSSSQNTYASQKIKVKI